MKFFVHHEIDIGYNQPDAIVYFNPSLIKCMICVRIVQVQLAGERITK